MSRTDDTIIKQLNLNKKSYQIKKNKLETILENEKLENCADNNEKRIHLKKNNHTEQRMNYNLNNTSLLTKNTFTLNELDGMIVYVSKIPKISINDTIESINKLNITDVFCFCENNFDADIFLKHGINFYHLNIIDGKYPDIDTLIKFNDAIDVILKKKERTLYFICFGGLGRAPTMLAYLMITRCKNDICTTILNIRNNIKGCFNTEQIMWLMNRKNMKIYRTKNKNKICNIM